MLFVALKLAQSAVKE